MKSKLINPNSGNFLKPINVYKVVFTLAAIAFSLIASADPPPVHFELGSTKVDAIQVAQYKQNHKKKEWVPATQSHGNLVKGHYIWR